MTGRFCGGTPHGRAGDGAHTLCRHEGKTLRSPPADAAHAGGFGAAPRGPDSFRPSQEALSQGRRLIQEGKPAEAVKLLRKADKLAGGSCVACQINLSVAFNQMGSFKDAQKSAEAALKLSQQPAEQFQAYVLVSHEGEILYSTTGWSTGIERELGRKLSSAIQAAKSAGK